MKQEHSKNFLSNQAYWNMFGSMHSMRSVRGRFISHSLGLSLKVHHGQCLTSMTKGAPLLE